MSRRSFDGFLGPFDVSYGVWLRNLKGVERNRL
jgi:hypothetical protein